MVDPKVILDKSLLKDVAERALWTAVQAFVAVYTVGGVDEVKAAATVAAGISVLKGFFSTQVGDPKSASSLKK
jgi:hypothetical protein